MKKFNKLGMFFEALVWNISFILTFFLHKYVNPLFIILLFMVTYIVGRFLHKLIAKIDRDLDKKKNSWYSTKDPE